jgi:3-deoxy-7-phosphoheptulonate synthase
MRRTSDLHVVENRPLIPPAAIRNALPLTEQAADLVASTRDAIRAIMRGEDRRLLVVVGPCSIHDVDAAAEYGHRLRRLRDELADSLLVVMRVYFEKPRTTVGWKGLINDPHLNGSYEINEGLRRARKLLLDLANDGIPAATELLDPIVPQYIADLVTWTAIGARTTESQTHREMASGLSMPVGFKNGTDGSLAVAMNAMLSAAAAHHFLGVADDGQVSIVTTTGNTDTHLVLRGGKSGPNYSARHLADAAIQADKARVCPRIMVDCSHDNAAKDHQRQVTVLDDLCGQIREGQPHLMGVMIESHLLAGRQNIPQDLRQLVRGQSITDACVDFDTTARMLRSLAGACVQAQEPVR